MLHHDVALKIRKLELNYLKSVHIYSHLNLFKENVTHSKKKLRWGLPSNCLVHKIWFNICMHQGVSNHGDLKHGSGLSATKADWPERQPESRQNGLYNSMFTTLSKQCGLSQRSI